MKTTEKPRVSILCSDPDHPVMEPMSTWIAQNPDLAHFTVIHEARSLEAGELLFLVSCHEYVDQERLAQFDEAMVLHASDLPEGRGWSPMIWQLLEGAREITVSLLDVGERIDAGDIRMKKKFFVEAHETLEEINRKLFRCEFDLMEDAIRRRGTLPRAEQDHDKATYYRRRTAQDSRLDPFLSIAENFDKLRLADSKRFPCYFELHGHRYELALVKRDADAGGDDK